MRSSFSGDYNKNDKTYRDYNAEIYRTGCLAVLDHLYYTQVGGDVLYCTVLYSVLQVIPYLEPGYMLASIGVAVDQLLCAATAIRGLRPWLTNDYHHDGIRYNYDSNYPNENHHYANNYIYNDHHADYNNYYSDNNNTQRHNN